MACTLGQRVKEPRREGGMGLWEEGEGEKAAGRGQCDRTQSRERRAARWWWRRTLHPAWAWRRYCRSPLASLA